MRTNTFEQLQTVIPAALAGPPLRPKQQAFVEQVVIDGNATRAARQAGYSPKTARSIAAENLTKPDIKNAIQVARKTIAEQAGVHAVEVLRLAMQIACLDPALLIDDEGAPIPLNRLAPEVRAAIQSVEMVPIKYDEDGKATAYAYRYRFADKNSALDKLFRHLGLYEKENREAAGGVRALMEAIHASGARITLKP